MINVRRRRSRCKGKQTGLKSVGETRDVRPSSRRAIIIGSAARRRRVKSNQRLGAAAFSRMLQVALNGGPQLPAAAAAAALFQKLIRKAMHHSPAARLDYLSAAFVSSHRTHGKRN